MLIQLWVLGFGLSVGDRTGEAEWEKDVKVAVSEGGLEKGEEVNERDGVSSVLATPSVMESWYSGERGCCRERKKKGNGACVVYE